MKFRQEIGGLGYRRSKWNLTGERDAELRGHAGYRIFESMRYDDPLISGFYRAFTSVVKNTTFMVSPYSDAPDALAIANQVKTALFNAHASITDTMACAIDNAATYGFAVFEIVLAVDDLGRTRLAKLALRPADTIIEWLVNPQGEITGIVQQTEQGRVVIPRAKLLIVAFDKSSGSEIGMSMLRGCYRPYYTYTNYEALQSIAMEKDAVGFPKITAPPDDLKESASEETKANIDALMTMCEGIKVDERFAALMPAERYTDPNTKEEIVTGYTFELIRSGGASKVNYGQAIKEQKQAMMVSLLANFLMLGDGGGSYSLADSQQSLFLLCISGMLNQITEQVNRQLIPLLMLENGLDITLMPTFGFDNLKDDSLQTLTNFLVGMTNAGLIDPNEPAIRDYVRVIGKLPESAQERDAVVPEVPQ